MKSQENLDTKNGGKNTNLDEKLQVEITRLGGGALELFTFASSNQIDQSYKDVVQQLG